MRPHRCAFWIRTYTLLSLSFAVYHKNINCTFTKSAPSSLFSFLKYIGSMAKPEDGFHPDPKLVPKAYAAPLTGPDAVSLAH